MYTLLPPDPSPELMQALYDLYVAAIENVPHYADECENCDELRSAIANVANKLPAQE